jgi:hypothetical protein
VDPELGRIAFPPTQLPGQGVWVSYRYGFSADIGGGEYERPVVIPANSVTYRVGRDAEFRHIRQAHEHWLKDKPAHAVIEIVDSGVYEEQIHIELGKNQVLELRASQGSRPVIILVDWRAARPDAITIAGEAGGSFSLDGILVAGRGIEVRGKLDVVTIRHSTLAPGWGLHSDCKPRRATEPSLLLVNTSAQIRIAHSILGSIQVIQEKVDTDPIAIDLTDSILDATSADIPALGSPESLVSPVELNLARCTILGQIQAHAIGLAENCIFTGHVLVARRQKGCMRFCYVPPGSRTPRRYQCQPDLVETAVEDVTKKEFLSPQDRRELREAERMRVEPQFVSTRYGKPEYCRLAESCAFEIKRGADDESEIGVFHDLFQPQRAANLRGRLEEYSPAGTETGIVYAS